MVASVALVTSMAVFASLGSVHHVYYNYATPYPPVQTLTVDVTTQAQESQSCDTAPAAEVPQPPIEATVPTPSSDSADYQPSNIGPPQAVPPPYPVIIGSPSSEIQEYRSNRGPGIDDSMDSTQNVTIEAGHGSADISTEANAPAIR